MGAYLGWLLAWVTIMVYNIITEDFCDYLPPLPFFACLHWAKLGRGLICRIVIDGQLKKDVI